LWFEGESFACGELTDTVRNDDFSSVSEASDTTGLDDDGAMNVSVFLDRLPGCHADPKLKWTVATGGLEVEGECDGSRVGPE
jgi:hypothetical protein